jgi:hypothetical protein
MTVRSVARNVQILAMSHAEMAGLGRHAGAGIHLLEHGLEPLNIGGKECFRARNTVMVFIAIRSNGEASLSLFEAMILVIPAIVRSACVRPFHGDDE